MKIDQDIIELLEEKSSLYNRPEFIRTDPVSIPHGYTRKEDVEISGLLTAILSWGQRKTIISNAMRLMAMMENQPYEFIIGATAREIESLNTFKHRTFNGTDLIYFTRALQNIYLHHGGLENVFSEGNGQDIKERIIAFRQRFFELPGPERSRKHLANPATGASAKRINMFLRWMVRKDDRGVDFGIWNRINPSELYCPLDVHSGNVARKLGLLSRKQNDWKAVEELTGTLQQLDPVDPVRFDFALFGLGVFEKF